jgi:hypothetical protein
MVTLDNWTVGVFELHINGSLWNVFENWGLWNWAVGVSEAHIKGIFGMCLKTGVFGMNWTVGVFETNKARKTTHRDKTGMNTSFKYQQETEIITSKT